MACLGVGRVYDFFFWFQAWLYPGLHKLSSLEFSYRLLTSDKSSCLSELLQPHHLPISMPTCQCMWLSRTRDTEWPSMSYQTPTALPSSVPEGHLTLQGTRSPWGGVMRKPRLLALALPRFTCCWVGELGADIHCVDSDCIHVHNKLTGKNSNDHYVCARILESWIILFFKVSWFLL